MQKIPQRPGIDSEPILTESYASSLSHSWGQYSPWFPAPSILSPTIPAQCNATFVQVLARHGSRYPTTDRGLAYESTLKKIQTQTKQWARGYEVLRSYQYDLDANSLTSYGQEELVTSGSMFFERYHDLVSSTTPFVRASSSERVVMSARNWTQGFHQAKLASGATDPDYPYALLVVSEDSNANNTLHHGLCTAYEHGPHTGSFAKGQWANTWMPQIRQRLNRDLVGADLDDQDVINVMDLCPYMTVVSGEYISPICDLFSKYEWKKYDYYQTLDKYYGRGPGNPLGPTQGVGFVNELIARLTGQPVEDNTSTNHTLDNNPATFPLGLSVYADFSHDNDMTGIYFALGLFNATKPLPLSHLPTHEELQGYSAAHSVPFAARAYFEKLSCQDSPDEEMVRVIVNDRVLPLPTCGGDQLGRCSLFRFLESLSFARSGGLWEDCFT